MTKKKNRKIRIKHAKIRRQETVSKRSRRKIRIKKKTPHVQRTEKQFSKLSQENQERWIRVTQAISKMRSEGVSLRKASTEFGLNPRDVSRLGKPALRKRKNGQYIAKPSDKLLRILVVPTADGAREISINDSEEASLLGQYWDAVQRYLQRGDASRLDKLKRRRIVSADCKRISLITDTEQLRRLGNAGALSFESLYAGAA